MTTEQLLSAAVEAIKVFVCGRLAAFLVDEDAEGEVLQGQYEAAFHELMDEFDKTLGMTVGRVREVIAEAESGLTIIGGDGSAG